MLGDSYFSAVNTVAAAAVGLGMDDAAAAAAQN